MPDEPPSVTFGGPPDPGGMITMLDPPFLRGGRPSPISGLPFGSVPGPMRKLPPRGPTVLMLGVLMRGPPPPMFGPTVADNASPAPSHAMAAARPMPTSGAILNEVLPVAHGVSPNRASTHVPARRPI